VVATLFVSIFNKKNHQMAHLKRSKLQILLLSILFIGMACSPISKYTSQPNVLSWEKDIREFEKKDSAETYSPNAILFTGSSSIRLWSTISTDMAPYEIIHRGYGGAKFSDFAVYAKRIIYPHKFKAMVFFIANDITGSDQDKTPEEVTKLCNYVVKTVHHKYPRTPVFWIEITPTPSRWKVWSKANEANRQIKELCKKTSDFYVIETTASYLDSNGLPRKELFREDQLHLNKDGYAIWTEIIKNALNKNLKK
jgi:hypothetical protein